ncbi:TonB-dependent receptor [Flagellimonas sp. HMM57]|uniref:TonB-dependent receptor n=1 Tax=unclassified Flagellimonas TaxID=2644544 RepID=UPI0013CFC4AE|nr:MULTISPECIES: TonB-dependent receptor [unclassified Flagellimonas]UII74588.1 TonB-dependent receptor [Flagellimonas sp. HMM57]
MRLFLLILTLVFTTEMIAQGTTGSIVGKLTDKELNNEPLAFANVLIKGTTTGTTSDFDGLYEIAGVEPGTYTVVYSYLGYETIEIPNVEVVADKVTNIDVPMSASAGFELDEVVVTTVSRKDSETALLLDQKKAVEIKTSIGAQELARKGVGDAEGAVTKVAGVTKQEGEKNVFVRGLGDRYNATTFNSLPLPSEDPEYKNISLDFFSSDIINSVGIDKAFNSKMYGDVGGAVIDIVSKELVGESIFQISLGTGANTAAVSQDFLRLDEGNFLGINEDRSIPLGSLNRYNFDNSFAPESQGTQLNNSFGIQAGKKFQIGENNSLSVYVVGSVDSDYFYQEGNERVITAQGGNRRNLDFQKYIYEATQIGMGKLKYSFGNGNFISYNGLFVHSNKQSVGDYEGFAENISEEAVSAFIRRQQQNENTLAVNQLAANFNISEKLSLSTGASYNLTRGFEPDRRTNTYVFDGENYRPSLGSPGRTHRFFSELAEDEIAASLQLDYKFGSEEKINGTISIGGDYRNTDRQFDFNQVNHNFTSLTPPPTSEQLIVDINNPDAFFSQSGITDGIFQLETNRGINSGDIDPLEPFFYSGDRDVYAGFLSTNLVFSSRFSMNVGARFEQINQFVEWDTNLSSSFRDENTDPIDREETFVLPSFSLRYSFNENSILRLAGSQSYTFPQFKEVAPFLYEDVNFSSFGFTDLINSDNYNLDLKYEYYFSAGEIISVTGFYKLIQNPINRVNVNSAAASQLSYRNSGDNANIAGLEVELRKNIYKTESGDSNTTTLLSSGLNASYLYSVQDLSDPATNFTEEEDELQGASPLLVNADVTYSYNKNDNSIISSLVFNYFSDRIFSLGTQGQANIIENGIPTLDFVTRTNFGKHYGVNLGIRNFLNPEYKLSQEITTGEDISLRNYKKGVIFSLGFNYTF